MTPLEEGTRGSWSTRIGFILAAAGSAVGLGNIWKFPYIAGNNGGGAFVLVYLLCVAVIGLPLMMAELMLGRHTQRNAVGAFRMLEGRRSRWQLVGWTGVIASCIILSYYAVIAGWTIDYVLQSLSGAFSGKTPEEINQVFTSLIGSGVRQMIWQLLFLGLTLAIVIEGVHRGIERWSSILMPVLFLLLSILLVNGMMSEGAREGLAFMFRPDFARLTPGAILEAMGHALFTLSLGMAIMVTYGSYLKQRENLFQVSLKVVILDTVIALMAGLAIFPIVFAVGMEPAQGPGLIFKTIPVVFSQIPGGFVLSILFFLLLAFAALTSAISLLEAQVSYLIDERGWSRKRATLFFIAVLFALGVPSALSYNLLGEVALIGGRPIFDSVDLVASNYLLPICGLLTSIYVGWFCSPSVKQEQLASSMGRFTYSGWQIVIRYFTPLAVGTVLYFKVEETGLFVWLASFFR